MRLPIQVQGIIFKKISGRLHYLLLKRTLERDGFWQPVTRGLEEEETKVEALERVDCRLLYAFLLLSKDEDENDFHSLDSADGVYSKTG